MNLTQIANRRIRLPLLFLVLVPSLAQAHPGHGSLTDWSAGVAHPFSGFDHLLAMLAVGLWAAQQRTGRARWSFPAAFLTFMGLGIALGMAGIGLPAVEQGIALSLLVFGLLIAAALNPSLIPGLGIVGGFALFHGHAHGTGIPAGATGVAYAAGLMLAGAILHVSGLILGTALTRRLGSGFQFIRFAGLVIAVSGLFWLL